MVEYPATLWKYNKLDDDNWGISEGWTDIAVVYNRDDDPVDEANARLIAQAPTLLAMLREGAEAEDWDTEKWAHWQSDALTAIAEAS